MGIIEILITVIIWAVIVALFVSGLFATLIGFPGVWLVFVGIFISALHTGFQEVSVVAVIIFALIAVIISLVDNLIIPYSTKYTGGSNWAVAGALAGGLIGLLIGGIIGAIIGPFIGAVLFEFIFKRENFLTALKAGTGTFVGFFLTIVVKFGATAGMIFLWAIVRFG